MDARFDQKTLFQKLREIDQAGMSGSLTLNTNSITFYIYFQSGYVVFGLETSPGEQGTIELERLQVLQLGRLTQGMLFFNQAAQPPKLHNWNLRAAELILNAAHKIEDEGQLRTEVGSFNQILPAVLDADKRSRELVLTSSEIDILGELVESITIQELVGRSSWSTVETLRALNALISAGIINPPVVHQFVASPVNNSNKQQYYSNPTTPKSMPVVSYGARTISQDRVLLKAKPVPQDTSRDREWESSKSLRSKIDTGKLAALAGVKIRSSGERPEMAVQAGSESDKYFKQARVALRMGNIAGAETLLRRAVSLAPEHVTYLFWLGHLLAKTPKKRKEAEGLLLKACGNDANAVDPRLALADLYETIGMKAKAEVVLRSILNIDPTHEVAQRKLMELNGGPMNQPHWKSDLSNLLNRWKK